MFFRKTTKVETDESHIDEALSRGVVEVIDKTHLKKKMQSGKPLRIKLGIDPTGADLHIGNAVALLKLRDFQQLGHSIILIIGDATGVIGDTSDKESERPMRLREELVENKKTYLDQAKKFLDIKHTEVRHNSEWLDGLTYKEIGEQADQFSVADFIARENIKHRIEGGKRVSLREVLYPLMQGYDSVAVKSDVELGGTDQRFNLLSGRTLQQHYNQESQDIVMMPLLEGTDGRKMSKSFGNTINILDAPEDMYGKVMRITDDLIEKYFILATRVPLEEVKTVLKGHPKDAKMRLACAIVELCYTKSDAQKAQNVFVKTFSEKETPTDVSEYTLIASGIRDTMVSSGVVSSKAEWTRLAEAGAIENTETGEKVVDPQTIVSKDTIFRVGKRRFIKIKPRK